MSSSAVIPEALRRNLAGVFGDQVVDRWIQRLPSLVHGLSLEWQLRVGHAFDALSYSWVAPCTLADGSQAVLKIRVRDHETLTEIAALKSFAGSGAADLIASDFRRGALLIQRLIPGETLATVEDDATATSIAARVMRALQCRPPQFHQFPSVGRWAERAFGSLRKQYDGHPGPIPEYALARAEETYRALGAPSDRDILLHGDLHHDNILSHGKSWFAIDPKGVIGEPEYECGALLRNPRTIVDNPDAVRVLRRRTDQLADELAFDRQRVRAWASAQLVLSVVWSLEGGDTAALRWLPLADALALPD